MIVQLVCIIVLLGGELYERDFIKKLEESGFVFERHGGNHDIYRKGNNIEKIPRHKEVNEQLARMILRKWKLL